MFEPPSVLGAQALLDKAFRRAAKTSRPKGRTRDEKARNLAIAKIRSASDVLTSTLSGYVRGFPSLDRVPPYYRELIDATLGVAALRKNLAAAGWASSRIESLARDFVRRVQRAPGLDEVRALRRGAFGRFSSVVDQIGANLEALADARAPLKAMPTIDPEVPTIVVAGYPNVGKSQFVRSVSTGKPRVAPYPFTTKGVNVGHVDVGTRRYQVLDTPGLLDRPVEKRNAMERQAVSALAHLADVVVFLVDPSETCGYELADQEALLAKTRDAFPEVPFLVVENKADLVRTGSGRPRMSAMTGEGVREILAEAVRIASDRGPGAGPPKESR